ncbi:MAG TPA: hypothetical protein VNB90_17405 [Cytophagaceae bacterium]|jgi:hypothetical protein|nr:hypothetical protein [Cytophagaceae bacterium]
MKRFYLVSYFLLGMVLNIYALGKDSTIVKGRIFIQTWNADTASHNNVYARQNTVLYVVANPLSQVCKTKINLVEKQTGKQVIVKTEFVGKWNDITGVSKILFIPPAVGKYELIVTTGCPQNTFLKREDNSLMNVSGEMPFATQSINVVEKK